MILKYNGTIRQVVHYGVLFTVDLFHVLFEEKLLLRLPLVHPALEADEDQEYERLGNEFVQHLIVVLVDVGYDE